MDCAAGTAPCVLHVLAVQAVYDLQSAYQATLGDQTAFADFLCFIIRKLRLAYVVSLGFLQCGIPHRTCRFYCCLAAHQRTRKKDSAEPSFPILWTPPHPPGEIRCGGAYLLPRVWGNIVSRIPVQFAYRQFRMLCSYLCSALYRSRFSRFRWACIARFSLLGGGAVRACGYMVFLL